MRLFERFDKEQIEYFNLEYPEDIMKKVFYLIEEVLEDKKILSAMSMNFSFMVNDTRYNIEKGYNFYGDYLENHIYIFSNKLNIIIRYEIDDEAEEVLKSISMFEDENMKDVYRYIAD